MKTQIVEINKTVQDMKVEREAIKKTQTEGNMELKNVGTRPGSSEQASPTEYKR